MAEDHIPNINFNKFFDSAPVFHSDVVIARHMAKSQEAVNSILKFGFYIEKDGEILDPSKHKVTVGADGVFKVDSQTCTVHDMSNKTSTFKYAYQHATDSIMALPTMIENPIPDRLMDIDPTEPPRLPFDHPSVSKCSECGRRMDIERWCHAFDCPFATKCDGCGVQIITSERTYHTLDCPRNNLKSNQ